MGEIWYVLKTKNGETLETNKDRSVLEQHKAEREKYFHREGETIEVLKQMPRADGWEKLPTIGDIKGMNDFGGEW